MGVYLGKIQSSDRIQPVSRENTMSHTVENKKISTGYVEKKRWTIPVLQAIALKEALGSKNGSKCDKFGSLSTGTGCP
jgi:hypothetical protein